MNSPRRRFEIYARLWRAAVPLDATSGGARARRIRAEFDFERRVLKYPVAALEKLEKLFLGSELIAAGVARPSEDPKLTLAPALSGEAVELVALRRHPDEPPRELLTRHGCLRITSLHAMLDDYRLRARLHDAQGYIYLTLAWDDWLWFDALGLPALYCADLSELGALPLFRVQSLLKIYAGRKRSRCAVPAEGPGDETVADRPSRRGAAARDTDPVDGQPARTSATANSAAKDAPGPRSPDAPSAPPGPPASAPSGPHSSAPRKPAAEPGRSPPSASEAEQVAAAHGHQGPLHPAVVIVAWSPSAGSRDWPSGLEGQLEKLAQEQQIFAHRLPELIVWTPEALAQAAFSIYARCGDQRRSRQTIIDSVEGSGRTIAAACAASRPVSYVSARGEYREALKQYDRGEIDDHEFAACQALYERSVQREVVERLIEYAQMQSNPGDRAQCAVMAELVQQYLHVAPWHAAKLSRLCSQADAVAAASTAASAVRDGLALIKALAGIAKAER